MVSAAASAAARAALARALSERHRQHCERSLAGFLKASWPIINPDIPLVWGWYLDAICEYLEAVTAGQITRLVINMPPRYLKSTCVSIVWPCWEWIQKPAQRWMFVSYADTLTIDHGTKRRLIIESPWFRDRWPAIKLTGDQNVKTWQKNVASGQFFGTSITGSGTGLGGNRLIFDDPHNPKKALSDLERETAITNYGQTFYTRLDDKKTGAIVLVMQRLHQSDLSGHCLGLGFEHLKLDNPSQRKATVVLPMSKREIVREEGDILCPEREGPKEITDQRLNLREYGFAGQYLQEPSPPGGGIFKREWWRYYFELPADLDEVIQSWDMAFKGSEENDYVAGQCWGRKGANKYLIDRFCDHLTFRGSKQQIKLWRGKHPSASRIFVEDKANGPAIIDDLKGDISGLVAVTPEGGKEARAYAASGDVESGNVYLPSPVDREGNPRPGYEWVDAFVELCARFPKVTHDDEVDAFTQAVAQLKKSNAAFLAFLKDEVAAQRAAGHLPKVEDTPPKPPDTSFLDFLKEQARPS